MAKIFLGVVEFALNIIVLICTVRYAPVMCSFLRIPKSCLNYVVDSLITFLITTVPSIISSWMGVPHISILYFCDGRTIDYLDLNSRSINELDSKTLRVEVAAQFSKPWEFIFKMLNVKVFFNPAVKGKGINIELRREEVDKPFEKHVGGGALYKVMDDFCPYPKQQSRNFNVAVQCMKSGEFSITATAHCDRRFCGFLDQLLSPFIHSSDIKVRSEIKNENFK